MAYAYDAGLVDRIMPRIKQFEATSGRRITPTMIDALIKGQLEAEVGKAQQSRALDLQERGIANAEEAQKKANKAATIKGVVDTASTAGMGYLAYKAVTKPSAMSELLAYQKGAGAVPGATSTATGAQTAFAGGTAAVGGQTTLAAGEAGSLAAYDASLAAGAAEGVGSTAGTGAAGAGVGAYAGPAAAAVAYMYGPDMLKSLGMNEYWSKGLARGGMAALGAWADKKSKLAGWVVDPVGHAADKAKDIIGDIGSSIGDIFGW